MESTLHRQLKEKYAGEQGTTEAVVDSFRIDAVSGGRLVEIQYGSLAALRDKTARLLKSHSVLIVKPIVARKLIIKLDKQGGREVSRRLSPKRCGPLDVFDELVYFTRVFPHERLVIEAPLIEMKEFRFPGIGRRRRRRGGFVVEDRILTKVGDAFQLQSTDDLWRLLDCSLPSPFDTGHLAEALGVERWLAQRIAYCLRETGAAAQVGKRGNALLYEVCRAA